jgi:hypothetical protein
VDAGRRGGPLAAEAVVEEGLKSHEKRTKLWVDPFFFFYIACFNITTRSLDGSNTTVTVRTEFAQVIDGKEVGVHGGWADHGRDVPPVKAEEENVLNAISNAVIMLYAPVEPNR